MKLAIVFWFYKEPNVCKNRLELIRKTNPTLKIYGLYGGEQNKAGEYKKVLGSLVDDFYVSPYVNKGWKWINGDLILLDWYDKRGRNLIWDSVAIIQWDLLLFDSLENQLPELKKGEIFFSGLKKLDKRTENSWYWTHPGETQRKNYLNFKKYIDDTYSYGKSEMMCCMFILQVFPRIFFDMHLRVKNKKIGMLEYKIPTYADIFNIPFYEKDLGVYWGGKLNTYPLNAKETEIKKTFILKYLNSPDGWRIFHPYYSIWTNTK
jgi:hypothetical protein